jgi:hypothetical protein
LDTFSLKFFKALFVSFRYRASWAGLIGEEWGATFLRVQSDAFPIVQLDSLRPELVKAVQNLINLPVSEG